MCLTSIFITSKTVEKEVRPLVERFRRLRAGPWNFQYIELVTCMSQILFVYLTKHNEFYDAQLY